MKYISIIRMNDVEPTAAFHALHEYKILKDPRQLFSNVLPAWLVKMQFDVISDNTLGLGATYHWKFKLLKIKVLEFTEQVVEWQEGRSVAYKAIEGWNMFFRVELFRINSGTKIKMEIDFSPFGIDFFDRLCTPVVKWGLKKVAKRLEGNVQKEMKFKQQVLL